MKDLEYQEQCALFRWAAFNEKQYPELKLLYASANGGKRNKITAVRLKRSGVKAGIPDIHLPVPRRFYHGLFIELKVGKNKVTPLQQVWIDNLNSQGYHAVVCYGWLEARDTIIRYLLMIEEVLNQARQGKVYLKTP